MKYRNNELFFSINDKINNYSFTYGKYTLNSKNGFCISDGEDPDHHISDGLSINIVKDTKNKDKNIGIMSVEIGRHGTQETASWFKSQIKSNQCTYNDEPNDLNFAFIGTLEFMFGTDTYTFYDVVIAQGHKVADNDWWFGGKMCEYIGSHTVTCIGYNQRKEQVSFEFLRGDNDEVNQVDVYPIIADNADWMKKLSDSTTLNNIMMPGSHDAGMSVTNHCSVDSADYSKTQSVSIGDQLVYGSRYFDIRVDFDHDELVTYHREGPLGCNGQLLKAILDQTQQFLIKYPSETAILKFSHIRDYIGHDPYDTKSRIAKLVKNYTDYIYTNNQGSTNLAYITLNDVRGKMILVFDYSDKPSEDNFINPTIGNFLYRDYTSKENIIKTPNIIVYDVFSHTPNYNEMSNTQIEKWGQYGGLGQEYLFLLSWTLTSTLGPATGTVLELATEANAHLDSVLRDQIITKKSTKPNIVYIDFMSQSLAQTIIQYNFSN